MAQPGSRSHPTVPWAGRTLGFLSGQQAEKMAMSGWQEQKRRLTTSFPDSSCTMSAVAIFAVAIFTITTNHRHHNFLNASL